MKKQTLRLFHLFCALRTQNIRNRNYHISPTERRNEKNTKLHLRQVSIKKLFSKISFNIFAYRKVFVTRKNFLPGKILRMNYYERLPM